MEDSIEAKLPDGGFQGFCPFLIVRYMIDLNLGKAAAQGAVQGLEERTVQGLYRKDNLSGSYVPYDFFRFLRGFNS